MKISCISDVHIKSNECDGMKTIVSFLSNKLVQESDRVMLLGDIFDHIAGSFNQYFNVYSRYFDALALLIKKGVKIDYVEGNHDVHLEGLYAEFISRYGLSSESFTITNSSILLTDADKTLYFSHGDEHDLNNAAYHRWKMVLMSLPVKIIIKHMVTFKSLDKFSKWASSDSKRRNLGRDIEQTIREKFRIGSMKQFQKGYSVVVGGHSHVKDHFVHQIEDTKYEYINNGYPQDTKSFIYIDNLKVEFKDI